MTTNRPPVVLVIRDGWGLNPNPEHAAFDAVHLARTPVADELMATCPWTLVKTSGEDVGLPAGTMGNSEVGHQNIGAGRIVAQESLVMTRACQDGLHTNPALRGAIERCRGGAHALHLMGIASDAGVHGLLEHMYAILRAARTLGLTRVYLHLFTDGRDTGPQTGAGFLEQVEKTCRDLGVGTIASVAGRYYAMDRDHRWERVRRAYDCLTGRALKAAPTAADAVRSYYAAPDASNLSGDEFVPPTAIGSPDAVQASRIRAGDSVVFFNYRGDRPREIASAFVFPDALWAKVKPSPDSGVVGFDRGPFLNTHFVTMTDYWDQLTPHLSGVAFPKPAKMKNTLGEWVSSNGLTQLRCAETEKYPHVTFFFNDYREPPFAGESRENPPSPKVATYDLKPEMAAREVCDAVLKRLAGPDAPALTVVNFANADMVGHTGNLQAAIRACEAVDACVGEIVRAVLAKGGSLVVTADHGNAEQMWDPATNSPHTAHTVYDVPLIVVGPAGQGRRLHGDTKASGWFDPTTRSGRGRLADLAPTLLDMLGLKAPPEMTGRSLLA